MSAAELEAAERVLTVEDREALGVSDARDVRRLVEEELRGPGSSRTTPRVRPQAGGSKSRSSGHRNGVLVMKSLVIAALVAAVLVGGVLVSVRMQGGPSDTLDAALANSREDRIAELEERLATVDGLREEVQTLSNLVSRLTMREREVARARASAPSDAGDVRTASLEEAGMDDALIAAATAKLETPSGQEKFYDAVRAGVQRYQQEERQGRQRLKGEVETQIRELGQGPYGRYNLKVNSMAKWLELNDYQRDVYHNQVTHYDPLIQKVRAREKEDPQNSERYQQERRDLRQEFSAIFVNTLQPDQAEIFDDMSDYEKRPDSSDPKLVSRLIWGREARAEREAAGESSDLDPATSRRSSSDRPPATDSTESDVKRR
jgi:hypothetical protein